MFFGAPGLKKTFGGMIALTALSAAIVSCGGKNAASNKHQLSGLRFRAFISNPLFPNGVSNSPVINIVDALQDIVSPSDISLLGESTQPSLMAVSPDLSITMIFSPIGNTVVVVDNTTEAIANVVGGTTAVPTLMLPGFTESMFIAKDNVSAYAAVPSAAVIGQAPGAVVAMNLGSGAITATIPVAAAHYVVGSPDGNHVLVFSDNSNEMTVINTALIGTSNQVTTTVGGFDRPAWGIFTDNADAYIFNCGAECGGSAAGVTTFTIGNSAPGPTTAVSAASYALLNGNSLYVAGTPPHTPCGSGTAAKACGTLNIVNVSSMKRVNPSPILITDGYHNRMQMAANGQLFIGARSCTNVNISGGEVRGCLSIFNTNNSKVVIPPQIGDATGIQPITGRIVVYVCQGGSFQMYDTTTDQFYVPPYNPNYFNGVPPGITGQAYDVKLVDPPTNTEQNNPSN
jgi:YVTN family beta-propeller protein